MGHHSEKDRLKVKEITQTQMLGCWRDDIGRRLYLIRICCVGFMGQMRSYKLRLIRVVSGSKMGVAV